MTNSVNSTESLFFNHWVPVRFEKINSRTSGEIDTLDKSVMGKPNIFMKITNPAPPQVMETRITRMKSSH